MASKDEDNDKDKPNTSTSWMRQSQNITQNSKFYKAVYAIRGNGSTRGMACAVNVKGKVAVRGQDNTSGSALVTWSGCVGEHESQSVKAHRCSTKHMGNYQQEISNIIKTKNLSFLLVNENGNDCPEMLDVKYLNDEDKKRDFMVYTISVLKGFETLPLKYTKNTDKYTKMHKVDIPNKRFDFSLCGSPVIMNVDENEKYFVGVLNEESDPCFVTEEEIVDLLHQAENLKPPSGTVPPREKSSGTVPLGGTPSGTVPPGENPSGTVPPGGNPSGTVPPRGTPSGTVSPGGNPSDTVHSGENLSGTVPPGGTSSGTVLPGGTPSGTVPPEGNLSGTVHPRGNLSGTVSPVGSREPASGAQAERGEEARPRDAFEVTVSASRIHEGGYWVYKLRINEIPLKTLAVGALTVLLYKSLDLVEIAIRAALERPGYQVGQITPFYSILVDLHCNTKESFLSFIEDFKTWKVKQRLEEEFKKLGYKGELDVAITNDKEVYEKLDQITRTLEQGKSKEVEGETPVTVVEKEEEKEDASTSPASSTKIDEIKIDGDDDEQETLSDRTTEDAISCPASLTAQETKTPHSDSLLADVLRLKPDLIEQLALSLDREMKLIPNWKHLSRELNVDAEVITSLEQYTDISPTIRLFEYLEMTRPELTIQQLKQALLEIRRNDLFSLLTTKAGFTASELVSEVITSRSTEVPSPRLGLLDEMALALDVKSKNLANWESLALVLGVPRKIFKQFERSSPQSPTNQLFEYLASIRPQMTVKPLKEALEKMNRNDLLKVLLNLEDEAILMDSLTPDSWRLQMVADYLDFDQAPWAQNWRKLAYNLNIPSGVYLGFGDTTTQRKSPTKEILQWLVVRKPGTSLFDIVEALETIQRNDAIQIITQQFPETVDRSLARLGSSWDNNYSFDIVPNKTPTAKSLCSPSYRRDDITRGSFLKQEDLKQPGHCGNLPDGPYVFKGREDACEQIITSLMSNKAVEVVAPPGYGKTSVVVQTTHRLIEKHGKFVAYVNPRGVTCVEDLGCRIIEALGEVPGEDTIRETLHRIRSLKAKNVVLIIENLDNLLHLENKQEQESVRPNDQECCSKMRGKYKKDDFLTFVKEIGQSKTIYLILTLTENNDFSSFFPTELIQLNPLSDEDSSTLFKERDKSLDEATVRNLVNICGGIPMIICTVLSLLKTRNPQKLSRGLSIATPTELIKELNPDDLPHEDRIDLCLEVCFRRLSQDNQEVLVMLSTFPHRFTQEQFYSIFRSQTNLNLEACMNSLKHSSLLRFERESCYYCIHPFIRKFCSVHSPDKHKEAKSIFIRHYSDLVATLSKKFLTPDSKSAVEQFRVEKENIKEATAWCEDEHPDTDQEVREYCIDAFNKAAVFLAKVIRKQEFESLFCKLSHQCRYDLERHSTCLTVIGMKIILSCTCKPWICSRAWYRAKSVLSRANEIQLIIKTVDDATRAQCLSKLGLCYVREGLTDDGFEYLNHALTLRRKRYEQTTKDKDQVMFAACHNDLAASQMLQRKHLAAIETRRNAVLPVYESILGNHHPFVATTLSWIASSYHELGEYDKAIKYATQALHIRETLLGRHQETARSYYDVGMALSAKKDYKGALEHLEHAVELQEEVLDTYEKLILTHQAKAVVFMELGRDEEAEREMERAGECAKMLDSLEVPWHTFMIPCENKWQKTGLVISGRGS